MYFRPVCKKEKNSIRKLNRIKIIPQKNKWIHSGSSHSTCQLRLRHMCQVQQKSEKDVKHRLYTFTQSRTNKPLQAFQNRKKSVMPRMAVVCQMSRPFPPKSQLSALSQLNQNTSANAVDTLKQAHSWDVTKVSRDSARLQTDS